MACFDDFLTYYSLLDKLISQNLKNYNKAVFTNEANRGYNPNLKLTKTEQNMDENSTDKTMRKQKND